MAAVTTNVGVANSDFSYDSVTEFAQALLADMERLGLPTTHTTYTADVTGSIITITLA